MRGILGPPTRQAGRCKRAPKPPEDLAWRPCYAEPFLICLCGRELKTLTKSPRSMSMNEPITFEPPDYLDSDEMIAEYTAQALASGDTELFLSAMSDVV